MASKIVLITGANSGVGYATTKVFALASAYIHVIMTGRSLEKVKTAKDEISALPIKGSLSTLHLDVTDVASVKAAAAAVEKQFGHLDVLINNAAVGSNASYIYERFRVSMDANVIGPAVVADVFRPLLLKSDNPYSIFVSSGMGSMGMAADPKSRVYGVAKVMENTDAYRTSKAALGMIALQESIVWVEKGLKTFAFCPGFVVSNLRGTDEYSRNGGDYGQAGSPDVSGEALLAIVEGKRDDDVGKFVNGSGVYPW